MDQFKKEVPPLLFPPKKILVPLDVSEASVFAWNQARSLSAKFGAKVEGLYVQQWVYSMMGLGVGEPYLTAHASSEALENLKGRLGPDAQLRVASGSIEENILSWERQPGYDLLVMGTHGRKGLERLLKGSIAEAMLRHSSIPVWVARGPQTHVRSVLVPVNFEPYALEALRFGARVAQAFGARLHALNVLDTPVYAEEGGLKARRHLLSKEIDKLPAPLREACEPQMHLAIGDAVEQIVDAAGESDLVVLAAHRKGFLSDTILGTTAERVLRHCPKPVLGVPSGAPSRRGVEAAGSQKETARR